MLGDSESEILVCVYVCVCSHSCMQLRGFPGTAVGTELLIRMHANIPIKARAGETVYTRYPLAPPAHWFIERLRLE